MNSGQYSSSKIRDAYDTVCEELGLDELNSNISVQHTESKSGFTEGPVSVYRRFPISDTMEGEVIRHTKTRPGHDSSDTTWVRYVHPEIDFQNITMEFTNNAIPLFSALETAREFLNNDQENTLGRIPEGDAQILSENYDLFRSLEDEAY